MRDAHPHGSRERYELGCTCDGCRLCMILHTKHDPKLNGHFIPTPKRIDAEPYARIIRELLRSGWTMRKLALRTGFSPVAIRNIALSMTTWVYPDTAAELTKLVELLPSERVELRRVGA